MSVFAAAERRPDERALMSAPTATSTRLGFTGGRDLLIAHRKLSTRVRAENDIAFLDHFNEFQ